MAMFPEDVRLCFRQVADLEVARQAATLCQTPGVLTATALVALCASLLAWTLHAATRWKRALNGHVARFEPRPQGKRVVCLGDSLTCGTLSDDYVARLANSLATDDIQVFNAGVNGDLVHNVLARLDEVWKLEPDVVVLLIGTMDTQVRFSEQARRFARKHKQLPEQLSIHSFEDRYKKLLRALYSRTRVVTATIPFLGEALDTEPNREVRATNRVIRRVSWDFQVKCVRFHDELARDYARQRRYRGPNYDSSRVSKLIKRAAFKRHVFKQPWIQVSVDNHFWYLTDSVHLNERAGKLLARRVEEEVRVELDAKEEPIESTERTRAPLSVRAVIRSQPGRGKPAVALLDAKDLDLPMKTEMSA